MTSPRLLHLMIVCLILFRVDWLFILRLIYAPIPMIALQPPIVLNANYTLNNKRMRTSNNTNYAKFNIKAIKLSRKCTDIRLLIFAK